MKITITKEQKITAAWMTLNTVVGVSTRMVIATAIASLVPTETKKDKFKVAVGSYVIANMVAEHTKTYARQEMEELIDKARKIHAMVKEHQTP